MGSTDDDTPTSLCFHLVDAITNAILGYATANLYRYHASAKLLVCDIDGTITRSNLRGLWDTLWTEQYAYMHPGVCWFLNQITASSSKISILYLTSRPMSLSTGTRKFLQGVQQEGITLPSGPLICNVKKELGSILVSELVTKDMHLAKQSLLMNQVVQPFVEAATNNNANAILPQPLWIGLGNAATDTMAYHLAGIERERIYQIDRRGVVHCFDKKLQDTETTTTRVLNRAYYKRCNGSRFLGYTDPNFLRHIKAHLEEMPSL